MKTNPDVRAVFRFNGTRKTPVKSGYRPAHMIKHGCLTTGVHNYDSEEWILPDGTATGTITFTAPEFYPNCLKNGTVITVHEGAKIVGTAEITEILNPVLVMRD